ncbi:MAG TPA: hypothetical protein VFR09_08975 [Alphaproteobacteria bacterium]|nr:hypothetical protein [Alphaproteobacteria bacterium]
MSVQTLHSLQPIPTVRLSHNVWPARIGFAVAYSAIISSGIFIGLLLGWAFWG